MWECTNCGVLRDVDTIPCSNPKCRTWNRCIWVPDAAEIAAARDNIQHTWTKVAERKRRGLAAEQHVDITGYRLAHRRRTTLFQPEEE